MLQWRTRTDEISIPLRIVQSSNGGPKLIFEGPCSRHPTNFTRIGFIPRFPHAYRLRMRGIFQRIVVPVPAALDHGIDFTANRNHGLTKAVQLG